MFYPYNDYVIRDMVKQKQVGFLREAETDRLLSELNSQQPGWLSRQTSRLLRCLAHSLMAPVGRPDRPDVPAWR